MVEIQDGCHIVQARVVILYSQISTGVEILQSCDADKLNQILTRACKIFQKPVGCRLGKLKDDIMQDEHQKYCRIHHLRLEPTFT